MTDNESILSIIKSKSPSSEFYKEILDHINTNPVSFINYVQNELNQRNDKLYVKMSNKENKYLYKLTYENKSEFIGYFVFSDNNHILLLDQCGTIRLVDAFLIKVCWDNIISINQFKHHASGNCCKLIDITEYKKDN
jgi:hypothetical protein